jgi:type II secretory pathway component PulK
MATARLKTSIYRFTPGQRYSVAPDSARTDPGRRSTHSTSLRAGLSEPGVGVVKFTRTNRRGMIFVIALGIILILTSMVLVLAQSMRTEASASANLLSFAQADAVERGAEMWVLSQTESYPGQSTTITQVPAEAIPVGTGWFWILQADPTQSQTFAFGITDEAGKLNLNTATSDQLINLPGMTQQVADNIYDWTGPTAPASDGAQNSYYNSLQEPYQAKNGPYETVEELFLVDQVTSQLLYGSDLNHNGVIQTSEQNTNGGITLTTGTQDDPRGFFNYVTCYSLDPNTTNTGSARVSVNNITGRGLQSALANALGTSRATQILATITAAIRRGRPVNFTLGSFFSASGMTPTEFGKVFDSLTATGRPARGLIDVNTAPLQVMACLPTLAQADAQTLVNARQGADTSNLSWFFTALTGNGKVAAVADAITDRSFQYSADIVAVSGDGRSFKRVRIVVDATTVPAKIIYRKDLTSLGWPLDPQIRADMRAGKGPPDAMQVGNGQM